MSRPRNRAWYLNPFLDLGLSACFIAAAEVFLKKGALASLAVSNEPALFGVVALVSGVTWIGIVLYILSFLIWLYVLRLIPLVQAYSLISVVHVLVPTAAWLFLQETISVTRWTGIALVLGGVLLAAGATAEAEEKL